MGERLRSIGGLVLVALLTAAAPARAQAPNIANYQQQIFAAGATAPQWTNTYQASAATCNQTPPAGWPPPVTSSVTNPTTIEFDDAGHAGQICLIAILSSSLVALPAGAGYTMALVQIDNLGQASPPSAPSNPFAEQTAPSAPASVRLR